MRRSCVVLTGSVQRPLPLGCLRGVAVARRVCAVLVHTRCATLLPNARPWPRAAGVDAAGGPAAHRDHRTYKVCAGAEIDEAGDFAPFVGCNLVAGNILVFALGKVRRTNRPRPLLFAARTTKRWLPPITQSLFGCDFWLVLS